MPTTVLNECARLNLPWGGHRDSESDVADAEQLVGRPIPSDYLSFLQETGGLPFENPLLVRCPLLLRTGQVCAGRGSSALWDTLPMSLFEDRLSLLAHTWRMAEIDESAETPWWRQLIPISDLSRTWIWCFDLRYDPLNPPVIRIEYDGIPERPSPTPIPMRWVGYVAPSFTELLRQSLFFLDDELDHRDAFYEFDESPYQFAAEVLDWQRSTEAYLTEFGAVESSLDD